MTRSLSRAAFVCMTLVLSLATLLPGAALSAPPAVTHDGHTSNLNYDLRDAFNAGFRAAAPAAESLQSRSAESLLAASVSDLDITRDETMASVRSLSSHTGYLSAAKQGLSAMDAAMEFVSANLPLLGLRSGDLKYKVQDVVYSAVTGATHIYLLQVHRGIPVYNGQLHINVNRDGQIISVNNSFVPNIKAATAGQRRVVGVGQAVRSAAMHAGLAVTGAPREMGSARGIQEATLVDPTGLSRETIEGKLMWLPVRAGLAKLVWNFQIDTLAGPFYDFTVDAADAKVWTRFSWTAADQYRVYAQPAESPNHNSTPPPADGRTTVSNPANSTASPFGWHDTNGAAGAEFTTTQGNNVNAYTDLDRNNAPDAGSSPSGGAALNFNFPLDLTLAPSGYRPGAVTNLFYWNNIIHDVQYQYGFDERAGNFQVNNYGRGGQGNDAVQAEAQDGSGTNNANFSTPPDGSRPRMQMFIWTAPTPDKDGDLDNGIVIHEFGHGISTRLVGGPANSSCLNNRQQPGEGLSDWWSLAYTAKASDTGPQRRGVGTYALNQPTSGLGIRTQPYSTNQAENNFTYQSINGAAVPHGVGSVWAQAAWEVYWKLVDAHGFDANLYNAQGNAGNQRMMLYVNEGLKNTICSPAFTDVRNGIIQAATDNHGGEDVCRMWEAFAAFGLGTNAVSGGSGSTTPTNGFAIPASCQGAGGTTVFSDNFETNLGWTTNPSGTDTATTGSWERGNPEDTNSGGAKQLGTTTSGVNNLVTGRLAGASAGIADIDGGVTSIRSPAIALPTGGTLTLTFNAYLAHGANATSADFLRVRIVGNTTATVFQVLGAATNVNAAFTARTANITQFAGQTVRILIEAADAATASLVEAAVDDVKITRQ